MPSPSLPHKKIKGKELFPQHPTEAAQLLARHANGLKKKKIKQQKSLQTSRHLSSILAGLKIKLKDKGRSRENVESFWVPRD